MQKQWRYITELIWPNNTTAHELPPISTPQRFESCVYLHNYKHAAVQQLIRSNKYQGNHAAAKRLSQQLDTYLRTCADQSMTIIPIPSSQDRWRERGYFHLQTILRYSAHRHTVRTDILHKKITTAPQTQVTREQRLRQQAGSFACQVNIARTLSGTVILFDDVITTGATMAAARAERPPQLTTGTKLVCIALAH